MKRYIRASVLSDDVFDNEYIGDHLDIELTKNYKWGSIDEYESLVEDEQASQAELNRVYKLFSKTGEIVIKKSMHLEYRSHNRYYTIYYCPELQISVPVLVE